MSLSSEQSAAFLAHGGFTPGASASLLIAGLFAVLLLWGVGALHAKRITTQSNTDLLAPPLEPPASGRAWPDCR